MQKIFFVSHTHWDREWYEPFQVFRLRLVNCIDKLLDIFSTEPDYRYFLLDGQTIVLEDDLEARPDHEQALRDLVGAGRVQVGPWYVLPDEFLVSGEAIIRNLLRGTRLARDFGRTMHIGYLPDPFGHISQMPQILRGFGFGTAAFRRGLADEPTELWWQSPDGTRVLACYLRDGYDNAAWMRRDDDGFVDDLKKLRDSLAPHATTSNLLLLNGTDHMEPWADLPRQLEIASSRSATRKSSTRRCRCTSTRCRRKSRSANQRCKWPRANCATPRDITFYPASPRRECGSSNAMRTRRCCWRNGQSRSPRSPLQKL